jgi:hypothetical protein
MKIRSVGFRTSPLDGQTHQHFDTSGFLGLRFGMRLPAQGCILTDGLSVSLMQDRVELHLILSDYLAELRVQKILHCGQPFFCRAGSKV